MEPPTTNKRVLCIEDEHFISELYARALQQSGYEVKIAADGQEGMTEAQSNSYDIILLDIMLPNVNGIEILQSIKGGTGQTRAKVIITTNLDQKEEVRKEVEQLADGYLIKAEITPKELVAYLNQIKI